MIFRDIELSDRDWLDKKLRKIIKKPASFVLPTIIYGENIFRPR